MRRGRPSSLLLLTAVAAAVAAAHAARPPKADVTRQQMEQAERARVADLALQQEAASRAAAAAVEAQRLAAARIEAAARLRHAETATAEAAARMDRLAAQARQAQAGLDAHAETMQPLLPVIERLSLFPAETLLAVPARPEDTLRGVLVLRGLARQVGQEAVALRQEQARLDVATRAMQAEVPTLAAAEAEQQDQSDALDRQITAAQARQREAEGAAGEASQRAAAAAARAETLRGVLGELDAQRRAQVDRDRDRADAQAAAQQRPAGGSGKSRQRQAALERPAGAATIGAAAPARGQLTAPVAGRIIRSWGDPTEGGPATGVSYRAAPAARVVAPCGGRVVFAAPFRSYGLLLIVDCGGGYHAVLAGFDRLDARVGQSVAAGEPVGVMPAWEPGASGNRPALYVELRRDGQPVNPAPWLRASG